MSAEYALYAEFRARPGRADEVAGLLADYADAVRREPGTVQFAPHQVLDDRDRFFVYERYRDDEAFRSHLGSEHGAAFNRALGPLIVGDGSVLTRLTP